MSGLTERARFALTALMLAVTLAIAISLEVRRLSAPPAIIETGQADVGGPFTLTDHTGRPFSEADLVGRPHVLYFGWSLDPDLTPAALQVLTAAVARLPLKSEPPRRVFISVDPIRDTTAKLSDFINRFGADGVAATGTPEAITALARTYKLYFKSLPDASLPGGYSIDHASLYYVLGRDGAFLGAVPHTTDVAELTVALQRLLN